MAIDLNPTIKFESVSVILPLINETHSLKRVVETVLQHSERDILEFIIVVCHKTTPESLQACDELKARLGDRFILKYQKLPYLGGAIREGFEAAKGSHTVVMFSDGESDPETVKDLIAESRRFPEAIVSASRWIQGGKFEGYDPLKIYYNLAAQRFFAWLYGSPLTDLTFGFRIFPTQLIDSIRWQEIKHPFVFESILKPMRLGVPIIEIPTVWRARNEGMSQIVLLSYLRYFWIGFKYRFYPKEKMVKEVLEHRYVNAA